MALHRVPVDSTLVRDAWGKEPLVFLPCRTGGVYVKPGDLIRRRVRHEEPARRVEQLIFNLYELGDVGDLKRNRKVIARFERDDLLLIIHVASPVEMLLMTPRGAIGWDQNDHFWEVVCG